MRKHHQRLKERVFQNWTFNLIKEKTNPEEIPLTRSLLNESRESLFVRPLDASSKDDPDQRYLKEAISHLTVYPVLGAGLDRSINKYVLDHAKVKEGTTILQFVKDVDEKISAHNKKVKEFVEWQFHFLLSLVTKDAWRDEQIEMAKVPQVGRFNSDAMFAHLRSSGVDFIEAELRIEEREGKFELWSVVQMFTDPPRVAYLARGDDKEALETLMKIIDQSKDEYLTRFRPLEADLIEFEELFALAQQNVNILINDIEDGKLKGDCPFERELRQRSGL